MSNLLKDWFKQHDKWHSLGSHQFSVIINERTIKNAGYTKSYNYNTRSYFYRIISRNNIQIDWNVSADTLESSYWTSRKVVSTFHHKTLPETIVSSDIRQQDSQGNNIFHHLAQAKSLTAPGNHNPGEIYSLRENLATTIPFLTLSDNALRINQVSNNILEDEEWIWEQSPNNERSDKPMTFEDARAAQFNGIFNTLLPKLNDEQLVKVLQAYDAKGNTPLHYMVSNSAQQQDFAPFQAVFARIKKMSFEHKQALLNCTQRDNQTSLLHLVCAKHSSENIDSFVDCFKDPKNNNHIAKALMQCNNSGNSPLHYILLRKDKSLTLVVEDIFNAVNVTIEGTPKGDLSPPSLAMKMNQAGYTPLQVAVRANNLKSTVEVLKHCSNDINNQLTQVNSHNHSALYYACRSGKTKLLHALMNTLKDTTQLQHLLTTAHATQLLKAACKHGNKEMLNSVCQLIGRDNAFKIMCREQHNSLEKLALNNRNLGVEFYRQVRGAHTGFLQLNHYLERLHGDIGRDYYCYNDLDFTARMTHASILITAIQQQSEISSIVVAANRFKSRLNFFSSQRYFNCVQDIARGSEFSKEITLDSCNAFSKFTSSNTRQENKYQEYARTLFPPAPPPAYSPTAALSSS